MCYVVVVKQLTYTYKSLKVLIKSQRFLWQDPSSLDLSFWSFFYFLQHGIGKSREGIFCTCENCIKISKEKLVKRATKVAHVFRVSKLNTKSAASESPFSVKLSPPTKPTFPFMATDWRWCWTPKRLKAPSTNFYHRICLTINKTRVLSSIF